MSTVIGMGANKPKKDTKLETKVKELETEVANMTDLKEKAETEVKELETEVANLKKALKEAGK